MCSSGQQACEALLISLPGLSCAAGPRAGTLHGRALRQARQVPQRVLSSLKESLVQRTSAGAHQQAQPCNRKAAGTSDDAHKVLLKQGTCLREGDYVAVDRGCMVRGL